MAIKFDISHAGIAVALMLGASASPAIAQAAPCRAQAPANLDAAPAKWLGRCSNGAAEGLGVLRGGTGEPYAFFAGRMQAGRPVIGLLMLREGGWMAAVRFDANLRVVTSDGLKPQEDDRVFAEARAAAIETAAMFRRAGNKGSADYYTRMADRIVSGRPE